MSPIDFEVIPELSLRNESIEFVLGMFIGQAVVSIQKMSPQIKGVELLYCSEDPLSRDIVVNLSADGIKLIFDPCEQRLKIIEVYDLEKCVLRYCNNVFSSPGDAATVHKVEQCFGATHPGVYDSKQRVYLLNWRGLSFAFPMESNVQPNYAHGLSSLQFPEQTSPKVAKVCIFSGSTLAEAKVPSISVHCFNGNCFLEVAEFVRRGCKTLGMSFKVLAEKVGESRFPDMQIETLDRTVFFDDRTEDVVSALGSASRVFYKSDDKMRVHRPSGDKKRTCERSDYFYNYFTMGMDILFDAESHRVKKFVLHTNYPGHYDFSIYNRCNFKMTLEKESCFDDPGENDWSERETVTITPFTKWNEISDLFCDPDGTESKPVVLNRTFSNATDNPFGATFCYGYQDLIFEVMANNHIASVTVFDEHFSDVLARTH